MARPQTSPPTSEYQPTGLGDVAGYQLAYDESVRTLELLDQRVSRLHTSYIAVLAFVGSGTAFLAGTVLSDFERTPGVTALAAIASAFLAGALGLAVWDLWPRHRPGGVDASEIVKYVESDIPGSHSLALLALATENSAKARKLRASIRRVAIRFAIFLALATSSTLVWLAVAWIAEKAPAT